MSDLNDASMDDAVEAVSEVDYVLEQFGSYYQKKYPATKVDDLAPPYVLGAVHPVTINGTAIEDFGLNDEWVASEDAELSVMVRLGKLVAAGDILSLMWGNTAIASGSVSQDEVAQKYKTLLVKGKDVQEGSSFLYYRLVRKGKLVGTSPIVSTLFIKGQPGVKGDEGIDAELAPPVMTKPASGTIGPAEAKAGVIVTVPVYLNMRAGDLIYLYWGNQIISHEVTAGQVDKPVAITVPETTIKAEGDSDELFVYYFVKDPVDNDSEWSDWLEVSVKLTADALAGPEVLNEAGVVISSGELKTADVASDHVVIQFPGKYQVGDSLLLHMVGKTHQDQVTAKTFGPLTVTDPNKPQHIPVPFDEWWPLGGGSAQLSYTLTSSTGTVSKSKSTYINILGMPSLLPTPSIFKVEDFRVDPDRSFINVLIPALANTLYKDKVRLSYKGVKSDGSAFEIPIKPEEVSVKRAGKVFPFRLKGETFVKPFEGGYVDISYTIERANGVFKSGTVRYEIGAPVASLPAPTPEYELVNKVLNPDDEKYELGMVIKIPKEAELPPCKIKLFWETSEGESDWDELDVNAVSEHGLDFEVPRSAFEPKGNSPVKVKFYYQVIREGKPVMASQPLEFTVATTEMQKNFIGEPKVVSAVGNKLNLTPIVNNQFVVELDNPGLALGDEIIIRVGNYRTGKILLKKPGPHSQVLPLDHVLAQNMQSVWEPSTHPLEVSYELVRNGTTQVILSNVSKVQLIGAVTKENLEAVAPKSLPLGSGFESPALSATVTKGGCTIFTCRYDGWYPTWGNIISTSPGANIKFTLRGLAKTVTFDIADDRQGAHYVRYYTASGAIITTIAAPSFHAAKPAGYRPHSTRVSFTSPSSAIKAFEFIDGGTNVHLDNIVSIPF